MCMASVATRWYNMIKRTKIFPQSCSSSIFSGWRGLNCKWILVSSHTTNIHRYATNLNVNLSSEKDGKSNVYHNPVLEQPSHNVFATADWNKSRTSCQRPAFSPALTWQLCNCAAEQHPQITQNLWNQLNLSKWSNCLSLNPILPSSAELWHTTCIDMQFFHCHFFFEVPIIPFHPIPEKLIERHVSACGSARVHLQCRWVTVVLNVITLCLILGRTIAQCRPWRKPLFDTCPAVAPASLTS